MVKRENRIKKSIESLKEQIEKHFEKLEKEIEEKDEILSKYHAKEIEKSFIDDLEYRMNLIGKLDKSLLNKYKQRLKELEKRMSDFIS